MIRGTTMVAWRRREAPSHALVVGGTGMLAGVSLWLAARGTTVSVVARSWPRLDRLKHHAGPGPGDIHPVCVDYRDDEHLRRGLETVIDQGGAVDLAICWIHSTAPRAIRSVAEVVSANAASARLIHLRGSASADPSQSDPDLEAFMATYRNLTYEVVALGFVLEGRQSRWLTDDEIVDGVVGVIQNPARRSVIGVVEPWSLRP